jgi:hypothetical protein
MRRRITLTIAVSVVAALVVLFWGKSRSNVVVEGTYQTSFEESAFFVNGDCSKKPVWWKWPNNLDNEMGVRWESLGKPETMHVKVRGDLSWLGMHGHLGAYRREFIPLEVISVERASRCQWSRGKSSKDS